MTPTVNTYANLQKPPQFRPSEPVRFSCYYSEDLAPCYVTLVLFGGEYGYQWYTKPYHGSGVAGQESFNYIYKKSGFAAQAIGGIWQVHFDIPAYDIGDEHFNHPEDSSWRISGAIKARMEFGNETDSEGHVTNPFFISNTVYVPLYHADKKPLHWGGITTGDLTPETIANASVYKASVAYHSYNGGVLESNNQINSYRYILYDKEYNILSDSKDLYDWVSTTYGNKWITFSGLENNKTYHAKVKATLVGGYKLETDMLTFKTDFKDEPVQSDAFKLTNNAAKGSVVAETSVGITHTKLILSRCVKYTEQYLTIKEINTDEEFTFRDYMCLPNQTYTYKLDVFNGELLVGTYYSEITHECRGVCIADIYGAYATYVEVKRYPISKNTREIFLETVGNKYPYGIVTTTADYFKSGGTSGLFVEDIDDCDSLQEQLSTSNAAYCRRMLDWLNNGEAKLLKYDDGFAAIIMKEGDISEDEYSESDVSHIVSFSWREIADKNNIDNYTKLGLVGEV